MALPELPTGRRRPHPTRVRARPPGRTAPPSTPPADHTATTGPAVSRVAACALGLAYAGREDPDGLRELAWAADADEAVLEAARARIATLAAIDRDTRHRADTLLYTAIGHLDRLLA